jgi:hypothetical protein
MSLYVPALMDNKDPKLTHFNVFFRGEFEVGDIQLALDIEVLLLKFL